MADPTAVARLQTQRFLFSPDQEVNGFDGAQWSDSLPVLLQARLLQSFENFDIAHAPLRGDSGVESALRLLIVKADGSVLVHADGGSYTATVTVQDVGGSSATATDTATVGDAALTATGQVVAATEGNSFSGVVGTFFAALSLALAAAVLASLLLAMTVVPLLVGGRGHAREEKADRYAHRLDRALGRPGALRVGQPGELRRVRGLGPVEITG